MNRKSYQAKTRLKINLSKKTLVIVTFFSVIVFYIFLTVQTVSSGSRLAALEKESNDLSSKNRELTSLLVRSTSLTNLSEVSQNLGYVRPEKTVYLTHEVTAARIP